MSKYAQFTADMIVADILLTMPEAAELLDGYGLGCTNCSLNTSETLRQGIDLHGMSEKEMMVIVDDLNLLAAELKAPIGGKRNPPVLTKNAAEVIQTFQQEQGTVGHGLKIDVYETAEGKDGYFLDFIPEAEEGDKTIMTENIALYLSPESLRKLRNKIIDYKKTDAEEGFVIE